MASAPETGQSRGNGAGEPDSRAAELAAIVREIQDRVRARHPSGQAGDLEVPLPDLLPLLHARDAAEGKVASVGSVNPRPPGLVNNSIQFVKRSISRGLNWFVRDQVEFNRAVVGSLNATLDALNESNRVIAALAGEVARARSETASIRQAHEETRNRHEGWERKLNAAEVHLLRSVGELSKAYEYRLAELIRAWDQRLEKLSGSYDQRVRDLHEDFTKELGRASAESDKRYWADLDRARLELERVIHSELRVLRQRISSAPAAQSTAPAASNAAEAAGLDYTRFSDRFRGPEDEIRARQRIYVPWFAGRRNVLDLGCGRGEFLDVMREAAVPARGIDMDPESVAYCRSKGLEAESADIFEHLQNTVEGSLDGIFCSQVIEHLRPERVGELVRLCARSLERGGVVAFETPNPECLAIFATHFYLDPTHVRPVPSALLSFYLEEAGFGGIEVRQISPAADMLAGVAELPARFREQFFGGLDYAAIARRL